MKLGILGTRGIPNRYGGFEQCAEKLALGLVQRGHAVTVYNSSRHEYQKPEWNGVRIAHCADPEHKLGTAGQFIYDYNCFTHARRQGYEVLLQLGYTSSSVWWWRWPGCPNVVNMDGLEWSRSKYSRRVQAFLRRAERWGAQKADVLVADSPGIQQHLADAYGKASHYIPYGAELFTRPFAASLGVYGLEPYAYHLLIARMEPENSIEAILDGYLQSGIGAPFLVIGSTGNAFGKHLEQKFGGHTRIRFLGAIYDTAVIDNLRYFSHLYFHGHSVGGTNPSLLEAMGCGALVCAHDNIFNRAILGAEGLYFSDAAAVAAQFAALRPKAEYAAIFEANREKVRTVYNWDRIVEQYEAVLTEAAAMARLR